MSGKIIRVYNFRIFGIASSIVKYTIQSESISASYFD